jgi:hypothetical protein
MRRIMLLLVLLLAPAMLAAQKPPKPKPKVVTTTLAAVLTTFLADSGVPTRGLPWTTGSTLPITWVTPKPVAPGYTVGNNITLQHEGTASAQVSDTSTVKLYLFVFGNDVGIQRVVASWDRAMLSGEQAEAQLTAAGWTLKPLKCARATEGYSYGNLLYAAKAPGKTGSGLHEGWNCAQEDCTVAMTIYYRKADVEQFDCAGA